MEEEIKQLRQIKNTTKRGTVEELEDIYPIKVLDYGFIRVVHKGS